MEEKESKKYIHYEAKDDVPSEYPKTYIDEVRAQVTAEIGEVKEGIIMNEIRNIGGKTYEHITIDRDKTLDALSKATAKKVAKEEHGKNLVKVCPACGKWLRILPLYPEYADNYHYCGKCGQKLDWSEVE